MEWRPWPGVASLAVLLLCCSSVARAAPEVPHTLSGGLQGLAAKRAFRSAEPLPPTSSPPRVMGHSERGFKAAVESSDRLLVDVEKQRRQQQQQQQQRRQLAAARLLETGLRAPNCDCSSGWSSASVAMVAIAAAVCASAVSLGVAQPRQQPAPVAVSGLRCSLPPWQMPRRSPAPRRRNSFPCLRQLSAVDGPVVTTTASTQTDARLLANWADCSSVMDNTPLPALPESPVSSADVSAMSEAPLGSITSSYRNSAASTVIWHSQSAIPPELMQEDLSLKKGMLHLETLKLNLESQKFNRKCGKDRKRDARSASQDSLLTGFVLNVIVLTVGAMHTGPMYMAYGSCQEQMTVPGGSRLLLHFSGLSEASEYIRAGWCYANAAGTLMLSLLLSCALAFAILSTGLLKTADTTPLGVLVGVLGVIFGWSGQTTVAAAGGQAGTWLCCWWLWLALHLLDSLVPQWFPHLGDQAQPGAAYILAVQHTYRIMKAIMLPAATGLLAYGLPLTNVPLIGWARQQVGSGMGTVAQALRL